MNMANNKYKESPGFKLKAELRARKITQRSFAEKIGMRPSHLSDVISGKRAITEQLAIKLAALLDIPVHVWLELQAKFEYEKIINNLVNSDETDADNLLAEYNELYDLKTIFKYTGYTKKTITERLDFCRNVLQFNSPNVQKRAIQGYFHKSEKTGLDERMIATWSVLAIYEASIAPVPIGVFNKEKCDELAETLSEIFNDNHHTINRITRVFSEYGIKFCIVHKLPHASIDGFSFYNNGYPCVVVTQRFDRIDNLAFAVLHEVGHLKLHLTTNGIGKITLVDPDLEQLARDEQQANEYAANALIPEELWEKQPSIILNPRVIQARFIKWAKTINKNKWIVLGRASHETNIYMFKSDETRKIN